MFLLKKNPSKPKNKIASQAIGSQAKFSSLVRDCTVQQKNVQFLLILIFAISKYLKRNKKKKLLKS